MKLKLIIFMLGLINSTSFAQLGDRVGKMGDDEEIRRIDNRNGMAFTETSYKELRECFLRITHAGYHDLDLTERLVSEAGTRPIFETPAGSEMLGKDSYLFVPYKGDGKDEVRKIVDEAKIKDLNRSLTGQVRLIGQATAGRFLSTASVKRQLTEGILKGVQKAFCSCEKHGIEVDAIKTGRDKFFQEKIMVKTDGGDLRSLRRSDLECEKVAI